MKWVRHARQGWQLNVAAALTFALGIGTLGAVLSIMDNVIWRPLPYPDGKRLFTLWQVDRKLPTDIGVTSLPNYEDWRALNHSFTDLGAFTQGQSILATSAGAETITNESVSANLLSILQVQPEIGRLFRNGDDQPGSNGGEDPVILSHHFWVEQLGRSSTAVGSHFTIDGHSYVVVGVMPSNFEFPVGEKVDLWTSLAAFSEMRAEAFPINSHRDAKWFEVIGRLKPTVSIEKARQDMESIAAELSRQYPAFDAGTNIVLVSAVDWVVGLQYGAILKVFLIAVVSIVLICCVNIAGLQLARWLDNGRNSAIRLALGASLRDLHYGQLRECFAIGVVGGCLGLIGGYCIIKAIIRLTPIDVPRLVTASYNVPVVFGIIASVIGGSLLFHVPVLFARPIKDLSVILKENQGHQVTYSPRAKRLFQGLVVTEAVCAVILLVSALSAVLYMIRMSHEKLGFNSHELLTLQISLPREQFRGAAISDYFTRALSSLGEIPGVAQSTAASAVPLVQEADNIGVILPGATHGETTIQSLFQTAEPAYFRTLQVTVRGREFTEQDQPRSPPVVIINERLSQLLFGDQNPIGRVIVPTVPDMTGQYRERVIVGVSKNMRSAGIAAPEFPEVWVPESQVPVRNMIIVLRTRGASSAEVESVRGVMKQVGSGVVTGKISVMDDVIGDQLKQPRFSALIASAFAVIAVLLTIIALQGLTGYSIARSANEYGIRIACGATPSSIRWKVVSDTTLLVCIAGGVGAVLSGAVIRFVATTFSVALEVSLPASLGAIAILGLVCAGGCVLGTRQIGRLSVWETLK
jgi:putative ABC transport system permease protein